MDYQIVTVLAGPTTASVRVEKLLEADSSVPLQSLFADERNWHQTESGLGCPGEHDASR